MRQVRRDELIFHITLGVNRIQRDLRNRIASRDADARRLADSVLAAVIVDRVLARYEILTEAPEGPPCPVISEGAFGTGIGGFEG